MMEKNNKWTERFTQWITCTIRYHCHKADRPTASNNRDWLFLLILWVVRVWVPERALPGLHSAGTDLDATSPCWWPLSPELRPRASLPVFSRIFPFCMTSGFQEGMLQAISSVYIMLGNIRSHDQAQGQCGKELHKGVDTGSWRSLEVTVGHRDVFAQCHFNDAWQCNNKTQLRS